MKQKTIDQLYLQNSGVIFERAWYFTEKTGRPLTDFVSLGHEVFMECVESWKPERAAFISHLHRKLTWGMLDFLKKVDHPVSYTLTKELEDLDVENPDGRIAFRDELTQLSMEAQHVASIILNGPGEVLDEIIGNITPKKVRGALRRHLRSLGWPWSKIRGSFNEIATALQ